jgi:rod shape-determining protein MreD
MDKTPGIRPRLTIWHTLDEAARVVFPIASTVLVMLVLSAPIGLPGQAALQPAWTLASIYFWSLYRPASCPALAVFAIGLLLDLLSQGPLGAYALIMLTAHATALRLRRFLTRQGFGLVWLVFILFAVAASTTEWLFVCLLTWRALPPWPALFECALAIGLYPILAVMLIRAHRGIAAPERA